MERQMRDFLFVCLLRCRQGKESYDIADYTRGTLDRRVRPLSHRATIPCSIPRVHVRPQRPAVNGPLNDFNRGISCQVTGRHWRVYCTSCWMPLQVLCSCVPAEGFPTFRLLSQVALIGLTSGHGSSGPQAPGSSAAFAGRFNVCDIFISRT